MGRVVRVMAVMPGVLPVIVGKDCELWQEISGLIQSKDSKLQDYKFKWVSGSILKEEEKASTFLSFPN